MSNRLYDRKIEVIINGTKYTYPEYTIEFDVPKIVESEPTVVEVNIYNLADTSVGAIVNNAKITINAGYGNDIGTIFDGYVEAILPEWNGVDKITTILATETGSKLRKKKVKKTYKSTSRADFIIRDLARQIGLKIGEVKPTRNITFKDGRSVDGVAYNEIRDIAKETNSKIYVRNNTLYVRPRGAYNKSGVVLNADSGLIGTPTRDEREEDNKKIVEYNIECLLNHTLEIDSRIKVESRSLNGYYRVYSLTHTDDFISELIVRE